MRLTHPSAPQLLAAVEQLLTTMLPELDEQWRYRARVAVTALAMVRREIQSRPSDVDTLGRILGEDASAADDQALEAELAARIRTGALAATEAEVMDYLWQSARDRLAVVNPAWLDPADRAQPERSAS